MDTKLLNGGATWAPELCPSPLRLCVKCRCPSPPELLPQQIRVGPEHLHSWGAGWAPSRGADMPAAEVGGGGTSCSIR